MADEQTLRRWLESERARGRTAIHEINRQRRLLEGETHGLARFTIRMSVVNLTGACAKWTRRLHDGLSRAGENEAAAMFASSPPFAATDLSSEDCDLLAESGP